jgi:hypothetical protein
MDNAQQFRDGVDALSARDRTAYETMFSDAGQVHATRAYLNPMELLGQLGVLQPPAPG